MKKKLCIAFLLFILSIKSIAQNKWFSNSYVSIGKRECKYISYLYPPQPSNAKSSGGWSRSKLIFDHIYLNLAVGYRIKKHTLEFGRFGTNVQASAREVSKRENALASATVQEMSYLYLSDCFSPLSFKVADARIRIGIKGALLYGRYLYGTETSFYEGASTSGFPPLADGTISETTVEIKNISEEPLKNHFFSLSVAPKIEIQVLKKFSIWGEIGYLHGFRKIGIDIIASYRSIKPDKSEETGTSSGYTKGSHFFFNIGITYYPFNKLQPREIF